jgi:signal transduction histidine kinase
VALPAEKTEMNEGEEILIFAPTGQDAYLLKGALEKHGLNCQVFRQMPEISRRMETDAGVLLLAEEALVPAAIREFNRILAMQEPWSDIPIIVMTTGGETTLASLRVLRDFTPAGNVTLLERPFRPITLVSTIQVALRSRRRQFEVRTLLKKQQEATRIRDEFISIASHELKTPLTSLKLQTQINRRLLQGKPEVVAAALTDRFQKYLDVSGKQVERLTRLIEDMLDVSRINAGKLALRKDEVDLPELIEEVADRLSPQISAAGCTLSLEIESPIRGYWDRYRIEQVIINLTTNAIRYGGGGPIRIFAKLDGDSAIFSVEDHGIGIEAHNVARIFERFERAQHSRNIDGLGLGLYICRQIVEGHGGSIGVKSQPGKGSVFTVSLPLRAE